MLRRVIPIITVILVLAAAAPAATPAPAKGVVNVNTASAAQLALLPHVGPALAKRIIAFRKANGPFKKAGELVAVRGISERSIRRLAPYVTVSGPTTLKSKVRLPRRRAASGPENTH